VWRVRSFGALRISATIEVLETLGALHGVAA
jgi:hypothetical protein